MAWSQISVQWNTSRRYVKKLNPTEVITNKNVLNMPYPESRYHPRQVKHAKDKIWKLFSLKVFKNT